jgi:hypothetical protein
MGSRNVHTGLLYKDSEPLHQEIGERIKHGSDGSENIRNMFDKTVSDKICDQSVNCNKRDEFLKTCEKTKMTTKPVDAKPSIVYGVITAKKVAKYRPCTQDIIIRPGIEQ